MKESPNLEVNRSLFINGHKVNSIKELKHRFGYVMQHDLLYQDFSPRQQLGYSTKLSGVNDIGGNVEKVTEIFSLEKCQNTWVGGVFRKGISGGEKKRTSIGLEVVTDPSVIFMDEPTTGLDSKTALDVAKLIKALAANGRTIISTIHQPSTDILSRFDRIICLCEGQIIYDGEPLHIPQYFTALGYAPPAHTNPADHVMNIVNDDDIRIRELNKGNPIIEAEVLREFEERLKTFKEAYDRTKPQLDKDKASDEEFAKLKHHKHRRGFFYTICFLMGRFYVYSFRNFFTFGVRLAQFILFGVCNVLVFTNLSDPKEDTIRALRDKTSMVMLISGVICFAGIISSIAANIQPLPMFFREYGSRLNTPFTYYLASTFYDIPIQFILSLVYLLSFWFVIDISRGTEEFFQWFFICFFSHLAGSGVGDILAFYYQNLTLSTLTYPVVCLVCMMLSGLMARIKDLVFYLYALSYLSFWRFGYQAAIYVEFGDGQREDYIAACMVRPNSCFESGCSVPNPGNPACDVFTINDFPEKSYAASLFILVLQIFLFRIVAVLLFYLVSVDKDIPYVEIPPEESFLEPGDENGAKSLKSESSVDYFTHLDSFFSVCTSVLSFMLCFLWF